VAETWPTAFDVDRDLDRDLDRATNPVRDAVQVAGVAERLRAADAAGELASWFAPAVTAEEREVVESEEGWVLTPPIRRSPSG
jgi:hypothetical protein